MNDILIIDDDTTLCGLLTELMSREGFAVETAHDGEKGLSMAQEKNPSLIVLDVMMPGINGFETLRKLRASGGSGAHIPVIMLTARGDDVDRIVGLEIGADDYLAKPFNPRELIARVFAILRRSAREAAVIEAAVLEATRGRTPKSAAPDALEKRGRGLRVGDVEIDPNSRAARCEGLEIELTTVEFDLLAFLLENAGTIVARQALGRIGLGRELLPFDRAIDTHISNLRRKLGPTQSGRDRIKTVRNAGYLYIASEDDTA